jgi:hypothetical protein
MQKMAIVGGVPFIVNLERCPNLHGLDPARSNDFCTEKLFRATSRELLLESFKGCAAKVTYPELR